MKNRKSFKIFSLKVLLNRVDTFWMMSYFILFWLTYMEGERDKIYIYQKKNNFLKILGIKCKRKFTPNFIFMRIYKP